MKRNLVNVIGVIRSVDLTNDLNIAMSYLALYLLEYDGSDNYKRAILHIILFIRRNIYTIENRADRNSVIRALSDIDVRENSPIILNDNTKNNDFLLDEEVLCRHIL